MRKVAGGDDVVQNVADRVVLQGHVAEVEVASEKDDVAEDCGDDREEKREGGKVRFSGVERAQF